MSETEFAALVQETRRLRQELQQLSTERRQLQRAYDAPHQPQVKPLDQIMKEIEEKEFEQGVLQQSLHSDSSLHSSSNRSIPLSVATSSGTSFPGFGSAPENISTTRHVASENVAGRNILSVQAFAHAAGGADAALRSTELPHATASKG